jgi:Rieske Fe-S protein
VRVPLAEFERLAADGNAIAVDVGDIYPLLLVRDGAGAFHAVSSRCTHQACRVKPAGSFLQCPCHGSTFELDGTVIRGPAQTALPAYPVTTSGADLLIGVR